MKPIKNKKEKKNPLLTKKEAPKDGKKWNIILTVFLSFLLVGLIVNYWYSGASNEKVNTQIGLNQLTANYKSGIYEEIVVAWNVIEAKKFLNQWAIVNGGVQIRQIDKLTLPTNVNITDIGIGNTNNPTKITLKDQTWWKFWMDLLPNLLGTILFVVLLFFIFGRMSGGAWGGPMAFIRSRARIYDPNEDEKITFAQVAWAEEEKEDLREVVDFLKNPTKYKNLGAKIPRGILLQWPPGTWKTLLARAVAGESNVPFFSISGSEFVEMFVGVGAARVRDLFRDARERAPSIIFIDEIDAIGKKRSPWIGGWHDEREQTLNQILTEMDGFDNETNVIVLAATNRSDVLDRALLRPGRFDRKVTIQLPNLEDRFKILEVHAKWKPFDESVDLHKVASITVWFSGADLWNLLNEAAILAGKWNLKSITQDMIQKSIEKVIMWNEKKSLRMTDYEKKLTAYHEVGHALVWKMLPHTDPVHKISILPRGGAGGVTWFLPEKDKTYTSKAKYLDELATLYGWRVAEEVFFGSEYITTGASSDIERATEIARAMVMRFGFDPDIWPENFAPDRIEWNFLGAESQEKAISEDTRRMIDTKVRDILKQAYNQAREIITKNKDLHEKISQALLEKEEMLKEDFDAFFEAVEGVPVKNQQ